MAMTECAECGRPVSGRAGRCPHCGIRLRRPRRSILGQAFRLLFIGFNAFMAFVVVRGFINASSAGPASTSGGVISQEHADAAAAVGTGIGFMMLLTIWALGTVILGLFVLFTRPRD